MVHVGKFQGNLFFFVTSWREGCKENQFREWIHRMIIQRHFTFADIFPGSLYDWKITPSKLNCNVKVVIHCRHFVEFLPWVATPVTVVWLPRSTWSHWLRSFLRDDHPPCLIPCSMKFSLACLGVLLLFIREEAVIWASEIAPLSIPRAPAN